MGLDEAFEELDGVDEEEFAERLQEEHPAKYKQIYSDGFGAGKTEVKDDLDSTEEQLEKLKSERDELKNDLETLKEEQPEAAELRGKYESKLEDMQAQIERLQSEKTELEQEKTRAIKRERRDIFRERAKNALISQGVDPDYASFKAREAVEGDRVQFDDEELTPKVYEEDGVPTPLSDGTEPHEALAENILSETPEKFVEDNRPGATGLGNTPTSTTGGKASWDDAESGKVDPEEVLEGEVNLS